MRIAFTIRRFTAGAFLATFGLMQPAHADQLNLKSCLSALHQAAETKDFKKHTLKEAFANLSLRPSVLKSDRSQPEFFYTFWDYYLTRVTDERVQYGRDLKHRYATLLANIHRDFGVRPEYLLAFWGLETNFGRYFGDIPVLDSLATLACDPRRAKFFTHQFLTALKLIDEGSLHVKEMRGSWAGAMGHTQFMPTTYDSYAVDYDGDGRRDLWNSLPDALASAANYLHAIGWDDGVRWGREVLVPKGFDWSKTGLSHKLPLRQWRQLGVQTVHGKPIPVINMKASLLAPAGRHGPKFLVYPNFHVIMDWNRSQSYALAVGRLADRIAGLGELHADPPRHPRRLTTDDIRTIQNRLNKLGYASGDVDGVFGTRTRQAIKAYQMDHGLPADGFPDPTLLKALQSQGTR